MQAVRLCNGWNNVTTMSDFNPFCSDLIALDYISFVFTESTALLPAAANIKVWPTQGPRIMILCMH